MYDIIIELAHALWKNGFSLTALGTAVFVLLKQRIVKKKLRRYIPWLLEDDSEVKEYVHNQRLIMERLGIPWNATSGEEKPKDSADKRKPLSRSHLETFTTAHGAELPTILRRKRLMKKLKSRKFILAVVGAGLIVANDGLDLGINSDTVIAFAGLLATWIVGESAVDAKRAAASSEAPNLNDME
ncbi:hypothetical protein [Paenibacillus sp. NEAU-GSW1]|uniref:hypothetical protein n=1 Tax=Paenibacillus sp. NEAU-GSW1 TaxID=2682486 RepID=UPI001C12AA3F|nr:hypothetical protein [Paenibacillus sp. NEAU-GSW1]